MSEIAPLAGKNADPNGQTRLDGSRKSTQAAPPARDTDHALVRLCLSGDERAWRALVMKYQRLIYSVTRAYFRDDEIADDVFQDVCAELLRRLETLRDVQALPAWLMTVTRRRCSQMYAQRLDAADGDMQPDHLAGVDRRIHQIEQRFSIERCLTLLSDKEQALIRALYLDPQQPSYAEIAARLDIPVSSIGPTRARSLAKLNRYLNEEE